MSIPALTPEPSILLQLLEDGPHLDAAGLAELTRQVAGRPSLWRPLLRHDPARRWYERLLLTPRVEVWLIGWAPGQGTHPHDHGEAAGALTVTEGTLTEDVYLDVSLDCREVFPTRTLPREAGSTAAFGPDHVVADGPGQVPSAGNRGSSGAVGTPSAGNGQRSG